LESVTAEECRESLAEVWKDSHETLLLVTGNVEIDDAEKTILATYEESQAIGVEPMAEEAVKDFSYSELPEPGKVSDRKEIEDLEITQVTFENNVRLNLKVTDFEDETIYTRIRIGGGKLEEPSDQAGLSMFTSSVFSAGGLEEHSVDDIKQLFAGKSVMAGFSVDDDAFTFTGKTNPDDVKDHLKLVRAAIMAPGYRPEALTQFRRSLDHLFRQLESTPQGVWQNEVARFIRSGDERFGVPPQDTLAGFTMNDAKTWLMEPLSSGYLEMTVVGDFDKDEMIENVAATIGSLPERAAEKPDFAEARKVAFPEGTESKTFEFESSIAKAMALVYWPTEDIFDIKTTRRIGMLGSIFDDRLRVKIREELGDAYSPTAHNVPSDTFTDYGYLFAAVTLDPEQADKVSAVIQEIADDLGKGTTITYDELDRAKKPQLTQIEEYRRTNGYWLGSVLEASQEYPQRIDWARDFVSDYENMTLDEIQAIAKEYLGDGKGLRVVVTPK